jgi:hypothetical protein
MAQTVAKLTALKISRPMESGMCPDGAELYLQVTGTDAKSWIYRYQRNGKEHQMGLGSLSAVSLADARQKATEARKRRDQGLDPINARDAKTRERVQRLRRSLYCEPLCWLAREKSRTMETDTRKYASPIFGDSSVLPWIAVVVA